MAALAECVPCQYWMQALETAVWSSFSWHCLCSVSLLLLGFSVVTRCAWSQLVVFVTRCNFMNTLVPPCFQSCGGDRLHVFLCLTLRTPWHQLMCHVIRCKKRSSNVLVAAVDAARWGRAGCIAFYRPREQSCSEAQPSQQNPAPGSRGPHTRVVPNGTTLHPCHPCE